MTDRKGRGRMRGRRSMAVAGVMVGLVVGVAGCSSGATAPTSSTPTDPTLGWWQSTGSRDTAQLTSGLTALQTAAQSGRALTGNDCGIEPDAADIASTAPIPDKAALGDWVAFNDQGSGALADCLKAVAGDPTAEARILTECKAALSAATALRARIAALGGH